jgi:hypothetical protein
MQINWKSHIRPIGPTIYNIDAPSEVTKLSGYEHIGTWGWNNIRDIVPWFMSAHNEAVHKLGNPTIGQMVPWIDGTRIAELRCFGLLMNGNEKLTEKDKPRYTYVRCAPDQPPTKEDFFLQSELLPDEEDCRRDIIYVPRGWVKDATDVLRQGIHQLTLGTTPGKFIALHHKGTKAEFNTSK